jgi:pimeloyl-ACP methyl ester carboxylesterase
MTKPAFVLVHGAWHGGWCWADVAAFLQAAGHRVFAPSLTGLADRAHLFGSQVTLATHVEDVVRLIEFERLDGCVLVGHSYGGNVITGAADRLRERVRHYVYLDAVVPDDGARQWRWADFNTAAEREQRLAAIAGPGAGIAFLPPPPQVFGLSDPAHIEAVGSRLTPMPAGTYTTPIELTRGGSGGLPRTYIGVTSPPFASMAPMYARLPKDPSWHYRSIAAGHDAMVSAPRELADLLLETLSPR